MGTVVLNARIAKSYSLATWLITGCLLVGDRETALVHAQQPFMFDARGGIELWSEPQPEPGPGYRATKIVLRTVDPAARIVTFEDIALTGNVVQTWLSGAAGEPTAQGEPTPGANYAAEWAPYDSHLLIDNAMVGGGAGGGYGGISEANDGSIGQIAGLPAAASGPPESGIGAISMADPTDAFFLDPAFQSNVVDLAYLVTPDVPAGGTACGVCFSAGVLGVGFVNSGEPGGAVWRLDDDPPIDVPFFQISANPGDYDGDHDVDGDDFKTWQRGGSPQPLSTIDLASWQQNFGTQFGPTLPSVTSVPEPATHLLFISSAAMLIRIGRRGRMSHAASS